MGLILAVNPGSTSTKVAIYDAGEAILDATIEHPDEALSPFRERPILDQLDLRLEGVHSVLTRGGVKLSELHATVGRGGLLRPLASGTYRVTDTMLQELAEAPRGEHASNLGAFLARRLAEPAGCPAFIVDPVSVDEWPDVARPSGLAGLDRICLSHALNTKAVAKRYAKEVGTAYHQLRLVIAHMGSGHSVSAHRQGRMVEVTNSREEGPFSTERAGTLPVLRLVERVLSDDLSFPEVERLLFREGGIHSYLGTRDLREVESRIAAGDDRARHTFEAMVYQLRKAVGAMVAVLDGDVDAVLLTGGMARSERLVRELSAHLAWVGPVHTYPGEDELQALAEGAARVLAGEEEAREYGNG